MNCQSDTTKADLKEECQLGKEYLLETIQKLRNLSIDLDGIQSNRNYYHFEAIETAVKKLTF